jgi:MinD superfamily P-loop ATPase
MRDGKPVFGAQCEWCMACIQWCPKAAINYKKKTRGRKRYHHPDITPDEMGTQGVPVTIFGKEENSV